MKWFSVEEFSITLLVYDKDQFMRLITITENWLLVSADRLFISFTSQGSFHSVAHPISKVTQFYACSF